MNDSEKTTGSLALKPKPRIITIPATGQDLTRPLRVAAYARVSSDSNDQLHSYAAQTTYFAKLINSNPNWIFADIYADQGITGTSVEKRDDFLRMMEDCRSGRIDRILVKSTSRFARNTKESLEAVRELKSLGVSVYFEEQNIDTAQATGEALTAVFSALAQKESEAISERMRHSYQMRMQRGVFSTRCAPYGYRLVDNQLEVIEDEAVVIRQIFDRYLSGISMEDIAKEITAQGIPTKQNTPSGRFAVSSIFCAMKSTSGTRWYRRPTPRSLSPIARKKIRARRINTSSKKPIRPSSVRKCSTRSSSFYPEKVLPFRPGLVSPIPSPARSCADTAERSVSERYAAALPIGYVRRMKKVPKAVSPCKRPNRRSQKPSSAYTSVSSGTGRKFSHNSSKLSRLPRPEDFSGVRISFHSTNESQILQVRNDCWPSSSSRPSSILTFLYPAATNWLNSAARQS